MAEAAYEERTPDGLLDPVRLLVLADALEEAGCTEERLLRHLRGEEWLPPRTGDRLKPARCKSCGSLQRRINDPPRVGVVCPACKRMEHDSPSAPGRWRPLRGPHVRGCWAVDLLLGKE
jgi:predicted Zn-ribbon and HTH transcriptional regulator